MGVRLFLIRRYLRCRPALITERDKALLYAPVSPRYGFEVGPPGSVCMCLYVYTVKCRAHLMARCMASHDEL